MPKARLTLDPLDGRVLPSASLTNGILTIDGTDGRDVIVVRQMAGRLSIRGQLIEVNGNPVASVRAADVTGISVATGAGNDLINLSQSRLPTTVDAGSGDDVVFGGMKDDVIDGGAGKDRLTGSGGNDILRGGNDNDSIAGGMGNDRLLGQDGDDRLNGQGGDDDSDGGLGNDRIFGGRGRDLNLGGGGIDSIRDVDRRHPGGTGHHHVTGVISAIDLVSSRVTIQAENGDIVEVTAGPDTEILRNGEHVTLAALVVGYWAGALFDAHGETLLIKTHTREGPGGGHGENHCVEGVITAIDPESSRVTLKTRAGAIVEVTIGPGTAVTRNGEHTTLATFQVGDWAAAKIDPNGVALAITAQTHVEHTWVAGVITAIDLSTSRVTIQSLAGTLVEVTIGPDTAITRNGQQVTLAAFQVGDYVAAAIDPQGVALVIAAKAHEEHTSAEGLIHAVDPHTSRVTILTATGTLVEVTVEHHTVVMRNGHLATLPDLQVGDLAAASFYANGVLLRLQAVGI